MVLLWNLGHTRISYVHQADVKMALHASGSQGRVTTSTWFLFYETGSHLVASLIFWHSSCLSDPKAEATGMSFLFLLTGTQEKRKNKQFLSSLVGCCIVRTHSVVQKLWLSH